MFAPIEIPQQIVGGIRMTQVLPFVENLRRSRASWFLSLTVSGFFITLFALTNEAYVGISFVVLVGLLLSALPRIRMAFLIALLPLAHAGFGLSGFGGFGVFDLYAALFIIIYLWRVVALEGFSTRTIPVLPLAFVPLLAFIPSLLNSVAMSESGKAFAQFLFSILLGMSFFSYLQREDERYRKLLLVLFVVVATIASLYGLYEASRSSILGVMTGRAFFTLFGDVNYYASFLLMAEAIALGFLLISKKLFSRLFFAVSSLALSIAIVSTVSRSALAVLILVWLAFVGFLFFYEKGARKYLGPAILLGLVGVVGVLTLTDIGGKVVDLFTLSRRIETVIAGRDASLDQRMTILEVTQRMIEAHPIIGSGFGAFEKTFSSFQGGNLSTGFERSAHNSALRILAETGIVGFVPSVAFIVVFLAYLAKGVRSARSQTERIMSFSMLASISSFLLMSLSLDMLFEPHFWVVSGLAVAFSQSLTMQYSAE